MMMSMKRLLLCFRTLKYIPRSQLLGVTGETRSSESFLQYLRGFIKKSKRNFLHRQLGQGGTALN